MGLFACGPSLPACPPARQTASLPPATRHPAIQRPSQPSSQAAKQPGRQPACQPRSDLAGRQAGSQVASQPGIQAGTQAASEHAVASSEEHSHFSHPRALPSPCRKVDSKLSRRANPLDACLRSYIVGGPEDGILAVGGHRFWAPETGPFSGLGFGPRTVSTNCGWTPVGVQIQGRMTDPKLGPPSRA